jgi:hypothetical protein
MSEEFIVEEEEAPSRSPFLLAAAGLIGLLLLAVMCIVGFSLMRRNQVNQQIAAIEAANMTTEAQNALVTQTVRAMETIAAQPPTATPTHTATAVPPTATATATVAKPSDTPVVRPPDETATAEVNLAGTSIFATALFNATPTAIAGTGGSAVGSGGATGGGGTGSAGGSGSGTLPQTGAGIWGVVGLAVALVAILLIARRLRAN